MVRVVPVVAFVAMGEVEWSVFNWSCLRWCGKCLFKHSVWWLVFLCGGQSV